MKYFELLDRQELIRNIERDLQSKVITFYRNPHHENGGIITEETYNEFRTALDYISELDPLAIIINSKGGSLYFGWRVASCIMNRSGNTTIYIPEEALSAASMVALPAERIVMFDRNSQLSPVDPQYEYEGQLVSALDLLNDEDPVRRSSAQHAIDQTKIFLRQLCGSRLTGEQLNRLVERFLLIDRVHADHISSIFPNELICLGLSIDIKSHIDIRALHEAYRRHRFNGDSSTIIEYLREPISG